MFPRLNWALNLRHKIQKMCWGLRLTEVPIKWVLRGELGEGADKSRVLDQLEGPLEPAPLAWLESLKNGWLRRHG